jgi:membrane protein
MTTRPADIDLRERDRPAADVPGGDAERPRDIPKRGWFQILKRAWKEAKADHVPLIAAGVAYYAFLAVFPAIIAAVLLYGLLADPAQVASQVDQIGKALPTSAQDLLAEQMKSLTQTSQQSLGIGLIVSLLAALWSASGGMGNLITAVNITYDEDDERGFVRGKGLSLAMTLGAIVFVVVAIALIAVLPAVVEAIGLPPALQVVVESLRWLGLVVAMMAALAVLYRVAPDRESPKMRWVSVGAVTATVLWVIASIGFSLYVDNFSSYGKTYGSLAGVVVLLLWLWITNYLVLLGAEINAEAEQQTARDTTTGAEQPIGTRGAVKADSTPG